MKHAIFWTLGIALMVSLGYITAVYAQDMVWLLVPGLAIVIALFSLGKILR